MAKLPRRLEDIRNPIIIEMFKDQVSAQDIATIFGLTTSAVYNIIKENRDEAS